MDENPYWTACRVALGREPRNYEFIPWIAAQHRECFGPGVTAQTAEQIAEFTAWLQERYPAPTCEVCDEPLGAYVEELDPVSRQMVKVCLRCADDAVTLATELRAKADAEDAARAKAEDDAYGAYVEEQGHDPAKW